MPGDYGDRLAEAEALVRRARNAREREAFEEIAKIWRRLINEGPPATAERRADS